MFARCLQKRTRSRQPDKSIGAKEQALSTRAQSTVTIVNRLGLHARPAMTFVDAAQVFSCSIRVHKGDFSVDGKSIMEMMMLAATQGTELEIMCEGDDADSCIKALSKLVADGFDED
jgi:phosphocarrier protein HPr